jgi:hypothetical protein
MTNNRKNNNYKKHLRAAKKSLEGRMQPAGRTLAMSVIGSHNYCFLQIITYVNRRFVTRNVILTH